MHDLTTRISVVFGAIFILAAIDVAIFIQTLVAHR
jgi:hypothetical protein